MNSVISSASAVENCLGGVRSLSYGGTREQVLVYGKEEKNVWGARETGCDLRVWTPAFSRVSNRITGAETRRREFATQLAPAECCQNRPPTSSAGVRGLARGIELKRGMRPTQSYGDLGLQVSGLVQECRSISAVSRLEGCLTNGVCRVHRLSQVSWPGSKLSRQQQHFTSLRASAKPGSEDFSELSKNWDVEFDGSTFLGSKIASAPWNSEGEASSSLGLPRKKLRASLVRAAILSRSPDTRPDEQHESDREADSHISVATTSEAPNSVVSEDIQSVVVHGGGGKSGLVSFHRPGSDQQEPETTTATNRSWRTIIWLLGPLMLTTSVFLPPLYLRKIFSRVLSDSLTTDFVILIFTETLFFIGASVFLYIAHVFRSGSASARERRPSTSLPFGYRVSAIVSLGIGLFLPVATFSMVWPWTGPAAAAALAPYMVGLLVQLSLEQIARVKSSPVWPLVPITFQMYRLHQLNRAAQLISGLMFSLKGVEATAETMAISGALQTLLFVLKILGVVCLGSLGAFLTHQLPTQPPASSSIASLP